MNTSIEAAISIFCHLKRGFLAWPLSLLLNPHLHTDILSFHRLQCERPVCCCNGVQQHGRQAFSSPPQTFLFMHAQPPTPLPGQPQPTGPGSTTASKTHAHPPICLKNYNTCALKGTDTCTQFYYISKCLQEIEIFLLEIACTNKYAYFSKC